MTPYQTAVLTFFVTVCLLARYKGGPPEQFASALLLGWILVDALYHKLFGPSGFTYVDPVHVVFDGTELAAITWLALRANRIWPLWAAAASLITFSGHLAMMARPSGLNQAYWAMSAVPQFIQLAACLLGIVAHQRRLKKLGRPYRSWRKG